MGKYTVENLITAVKNPTAVFGEISAAGLKVNRWYHGKFSDNDGICVADQDWDNLIILDGCRYGLFEEVHQLNGDLTAVQSRGSTSVEFLDENFADRTCHDTVYVSANPYTYKLDSGTFHRVYDLLTSDWNTTEQTVLPDRVAERTIEAHQQHPDKRLIAHFMQPHYPFIGELGKQINHRGYTNKHGDDQETTAKYTVWGMLQYNIDGLTPEFVWKAYRENLEVALEHVEQLIEKLDGKTVITADHGNLVGERLSPVPVKGYGHPGYLRVEELTRVPWLEIESDTRREIVPEPPATETDQPEVDEEKLEALGYLE